MSPIHVYSCNFTNFVGFSRQYKTLDVTESQNKNDTEKSETLLRNSRKETGNKKRKRENENGNLKTRRLLNSSLYRIDAYQERHV